MSDAGEVNPDVTPPRAGKRRLFFALWPDEEVRRRLGHLLENSLRIRSGRPEQIDKLHVTLVFIGDADDGRIACLEQAAAGVPAGAFELVLDRIGYWGRPRILWLASRQAPPAALSLVRALNAALESCGLTAEQRPYRPHMTLARKVRHPPRDNSIDPIRWRVESYALMESIPREKGTAYRVLRVWPLQPGDEPREPQETAD